MSDWKVVNHGHPEIKPSKDRRAIFIGRYQPYHMGHVSLVKQKLDKGVPCLIMVRDIPPEPQNPFTTEQTVDMIRKYHASKGDDVVVMVIPDIESVNWGRGGYRVCQLGKGCRIRNERILSARGYRVHLRDKDKERDNGRQRRLAETRR